MTFLSPTALWLLALLPVVVALHYLRARRRRYEVPALFLWQRAQTAVAKRRRFSPTWLLAAQLAFVALAAVALARPALLGGERPDRVILIDASASMAAVAAEGTRLDAAREGARELLSGSGRVALIRAGLDARLLAPLNAEQSDLLGALGELRAGDAAGDLLRAMELASALLPGAEVHVFTDHDTALGVAQVHRVDTAAENVGISAFEIGVGQAFVAVVASGARPAQVDVALRQDGRQLASGTVLVPGGGTGTVTFPLVDVSGVVEARITPPPGDALALDDVAYAGSRALEVVTNDAYEPLLRALAAVPLTRVGIAPDAAFRPSADLKVVVRAGPDGLPPGNYLLFPPRAAEPEYLLVSDWNRAHPLMRFVDLRDVVVGLDPERGAWEEEGWQVLARAADLTPLIRVRQDEGGKVVQLAFHPAQSDVVLRPAFPALVANLMGTLETTVRVRLGEPLPGGAEPVLTPGPHALPAAAAGEMDGAVAYASLLAPEESRLPASGPGLASGATSPATAATPATPASAATGAPSAAGDLSGQPSGTAAASGGAPGGAPTPAALVLLGLAVMALVAEWLLFSGGKARRLVG